MTPESRQFFADATRLYRTLLDRAEWISLRLEPACQHSQIAAIEKAHGRAVPMPLANVLKSVTSQFELSYEHPSIEMGGFEFGLQAIGDALGSWTESWLDDDEDSIPFVARLSTGHIEIEPSSLFPIVTDFSGDYLLLAPDLGDGTVFAALHDFDIHGLMKIASSVAELLQRSIVLGAPTIEGWREFQSADVDEIDLGSPAAQQRLALLQQS